MSQAHTYEVRGMTCDHCARAVIAELNKLDAITEISVDLVPEGISAVTVVSSTDVPLAAVRDAIDHAGYELVGTPSR
jgi:copper chaperone CopZ